jgi:predicted enzyme related to lactoylglutathione lyase
MKHLTNWVEIPTTEIRRAIAFYSSILDIELHEMEMGGCNYALFPSDDKFNCGALVQGEQYKPSSDGVIVYLDGGKDLDIILSKVAKAGGQIVVEKMFMSAEAGYIGMFIDTEGNKIIIKNSSNRNAFT